MSASHPLPSRTMQGGWIDRKSHTRGPNGRGLCRWCSLEVPPRRFTFCSDFCVHEWKLRTQPAYLRQQVFKRDRGICTNCHVDTLAAHRQLKRSRSSSRTTLMHHWGLKALLRKSLWDADHIIPVAEGGGECELENIRTLCLRCHRLATSQLRERIRRTKVAAISLQPHQKARHLPSSPLLPDKMGIASTSRSTGNFS